MAGLVLFDLDNTLLDRDGAFAKWASIFVNNHDLSRDAWSVIESADEDGLRPRDQFFEFLRESLSIKASIGELLDSYHDEYPRCYTVSGETLGAVRRLRVSGWKVGVTTNGTEGQDSRDHGRGQRHRPRHRHSVLEGWREHRVGRHRGRPAEYSGRRDALARRHGDRRAL